MRSQKYRKPDVFLNHNSKVHCVRFSAEGALYRLATPGQCIVFRDLPTQCNEEHAPGSECGVCRVAGSVEDFKLFTNLLLAAGKVILGPDDNIRLDGTSEYTVPMRVDRQSDIDQMATINAPKGERVWRLLQRCANELRNQKKG